MRKAVAALALSAMPLAAQDATDLTLELGGDLWTHGGVVVVYPLPIDPETWRATAGDKPITRRLRDRYAQVQIRYPETGTFVYRFRPEEGLADAESSATQVLSVIGTNGEGEGPQMEVGFADAVSSGGRVIRVPPIAELTGDVAAGWGTTQAYADPPPADERGARVLAGIFRDPNRPIPLDCRVRHGNPGSGVVQICVPFDWTLDQIALRWWRGVAESRLERLRHHALRDCYDSTIFGGGFCNPTPGTDEPTYTHSR